MFGTSRSCWPQKRRDTSHDPSAFVSRCQGPHGRRATPVPAHSVTSTGAQPGTSARGLTSGLKGGGISSLLNTPIDLYPTLTLSNSNHYQHTSDKSWCVGSLQTVGLGPDLDVSSLGRSGKLAVGYSHYYDPGNDPFPCDAQDATYYRGSVGFDMNALGTYVHDHGLKSAYLEFRLDTGNGSCIDHIGVSSDPWENLGGGLGGELDVTAPLALSLAYGNPHMHYVFVGKDENVYAQDNNTCDSVINNLFLVVTPQS
jgi:hypothetical protein